MMAFCRSLLEASSALISFTLTTDDLRPPSKCIGRSESPGAYESYNDTMSDKCQQLTSYNGTETKAGVAGTTYRVEYKDAHSYESKDTSDKSDCTGAV